MIVVISLVACCCCIVIHVVRDSFHVRKYQQRKTHSCISWSSLCSSSSMTLARDALLCGCCISGFPFSSFPFNITSSLSRLNTARKASNSSSPHFSSPSPANLVNAAHNRASVSASLHAARPTHTATLSRAAKSEKPT